MPVKFLEEGTTIPFETIDNNFKELYPIGSIFMSTVADSPRKVASDFGFGVWERYNTDNRVIVGVDNETSNGPYKKPDVAIKHTDSTVARQIRGAERISNTRIRLDLRADEDANNEKLAVGQKIKVSGIPATIPAGTGRIEITGVAEPNDYFNGTYLYNPTQGVWYNSTNGEPPENPLGVFWYNRNAPNGRGRWQFGPRIDDAKTTIGGYNGAFLQEGGVTPIFWGTNENENWQGYNARSIAITKSMSFVATFEDSDVSAENDPNGIMKIVDTTNYSNQVIASPPNVQPAGVIYPILPLTPSQYKLFSDLGEKGGDSDVTLDTPQMFEHTHGGYDTINDHGVLYDNFAYGSVLNSSNSSTLRESFITRQLFSVYPAFGRRANSSKEGSGQSHLNEQPARRVWMYKRIG